MVGYLKGEQGGSYVLGVVKATFVCLECCACVGCLSFWQT